MKFGLIGCGFMGEAILSAVLEHGVVTPADVFVAEVNPERCAAVGSRYGVTAGADPLAVAASADVIVLALKPQEFAAAAALMRGRLRDGQTVVSIMAGVTMDTLATALGHATIVRAMPNTPAAIGEGMTVWAAALEVNDATRAQVGAIFAALGKEVPVENEKYLDMATALSGSGPGFVYLLLEAFIDAGVHIGFRRDVAETLALQTFLGSARYATETGKHPAQLRNEVTSPAGTTAAGLQVLEDAGIRGIIIDAIEAAYERSRELGAQ